MIDLYYIWDNLRLLFANHSGKIRWTVNFCFLFATTLLFSPEIASRLVLPWLVFAVGNILWALDSLLQKNYVYVWSGSIFIAYDLALVYSRIVGTDTSSWTSWIANFLNKILL